MNGLEWHYYQMYVNIGNFYKKKKGEIKTLYTPKLWVPVLVIKNVYVFPGIPELFETMISYHAEEFVS